MATTLALAMRASMSASGVVSGTNDAARAMDRMGKQARQTARDVSTLKNLAIGAMVAKGATAAANAFVSASKSALSYASSVSQTVDAINDMSERTGMAAEQLQVLKMAAALSGVEDLTSTVQKLTVVIGQAAASGKTDAFTNLGLDFASLQSMSPDEQFKAIQQAISSLATPAERAAAAVSIFGKSGIELLPLMNQNLDEIENKMRRLGAIVGTDQVEAIDSMNDRLAEVQSTFEGIAGNVVGNLAPIVESLASEFLAFVEAFNSISGDGGQGVANVITNALLDIYDVLAPMFDRAVEYFSNFGEHMAKVSETFSFVGNVFTAVAETLRAGFNMFEAAGNLFAVGIGKLLEGLGSWVSDDLESFGKNMAASAQAELEKNSAQGNQAFKNAGSAASAAVFGSGGPENTTSGAFTRASQAARSRMTPEARAQRDAERQARAADAKAAREAAAADAKSRQDAEANKKRQAEAAKVGENAAGVQKGIDQITSERFAALSGKSNESLKANDVRSSEGMAQFIALATGREDPAIAEYRKQTQKLDELRAELRALNQQQVEILGAAA